MYKSQINLRSIAYRGKYFNYDGLKNLTSFIIANYTVFMCCYLYQEFMFLGRIRVSVSFKSN